MQSGAGRGRGVRRGLGRSRAWNVNRVDSAVGAATLGNQAGVGSHTHPLQHGMSSLPCPSPLSIRASKGRSNTRQAHNPIEGCERQVIHLTTPFRRFKQKRSAAVDKDSRGCTGFLQRHCAGGRMRTKTIASGKKQGRDRISPTRGQAQPRVRGDTPALKQHGGTRAT